MGSPLEIPIQLSGTFGEFRSNHFHAGIDIRTQGKTGVKVKSVQNGWINRIRISTSGYGKAIYIQHRMTDNFSLCPSKKICA